MEKTPRKIPVRAKIRESAPLLIKLNNTTAGGTVNLKVSRHRRLISRYLMVKVCSQPRLFPHRRSFVLLSTSHSIQYSGFHIPSSHPRITVVLEHNAIYDSLNTHTETQYSSSSPYNITCINNYCNLG
jgi:hypothetical protein